MASVTLATLRQRALERADMVNSDFIEDDELLEYINSSYAELYDILVSKFEDYYTPAPTPFSITSGNTYNLPSDFYKLRGVDYLISGSDYVPLRKFNFNERHADSTVRRFRGTSKLRYRIVGTKLYIEPAANAVGSYQIWYIPLFTPLSSESDTVNGVNGWEEYIVVDAAIKMLNKEESDTGSLEVAKAKLLERIENMAQNRDADQPESVTDVTRQGYYDDFDRF